MASDVPDDTGQTANCQVSFLLQEACQQHNDGVLCPGALLFIIGHIGSTIGHWLLQLHTIQVYLYNILAMP